MTRALTTAEVLLEPGQTVLVQLLIAGELEPPGMMGNAVIKSHMLHGNQAAAALPGLPLQHLAPLEARAQLVSSSPPPCTPPHKHPTPDRFDAYSDSAVYIMEESLVIVPAPFNVTVTTSASKPQGRRWQW